MFTKKPIIYLVKGLRWFILITVPTVLMLLLSLILVTASGHKTLSLVVSGSMEPEIMTGAYVILQDVEQANIGDIVTYNHPNGVTIIHRIIDEKVIDGENCFILKGDNMRRRDSTTPKTSEVKQTLVKAFNWTAPFVQFICTGKKVSEKTFEIRMLIILCTFVVLFILCLPKDKPKSIDKKSIPEKSNLEALHKERGISNEHSN